MSQAWYKTERAPRQKGWRKVFIKCPECMRGGRQGCWLPDRRPEKVPRRWHMTLLDRQNSDLGAWLGESFCILERNNNMGTGPWVTNCVVCIHWSIDRLEAPAECLLCASHGPMQGMGLTHSAPGAHGPASYHVMTPPDRPGPRALEPTEEQRFSLPTGVRKGFRDKNAIW